MDRIPSKKADQNQLALFGVLELVVKDFERGFRQHSQPAFIAGRDLSWRRSQMSFSGKSSVGPSVDGSEWHIEHSDGGDCTVERAGL